MALERQPSQQSSSKACSSVKDLFVMGKFLGNGLSGHVRVVKDKENAQEYVLKTILADRPLEGVSNPRLEVAGLRHVSGHPHILDLLCLFEDKVGSHLLMDFCKEGDLCEYILRKKRLRLNESESAVIIRQVASALQYCHEVNLLHRDVKAENIFLQGRVTRSDGKSFPRVKLADFGSSVILPSSGEKVKGLAGTLLYSAPEVLESKPYGSAADMWSLGVVLYVSLSGMLPYYGEDPQEMLKSIRASELTFCNSLWSSVSDDALDLILWMLSPDPGLRATADNVLNHPWIVRHCGSGLEVSMDPCEGSRTAVAAEEGSKHVSKASLKERQRRCHFKARDSERVRFVHLAAVLCSSSGAKEAKLQSGDQPCSSL